MLNWRQESQKLLMASLHGVVYYIEVPPLGDDGAMTIFASVIGRDETGRYWSENLGSFDDLNIGKAKEACEQHALCRVLEQLR